MVVRLSLDGRIEVADREVRPTQLKLSFDAGVAEIKQVGTIRPPESVAEYRRIERPRNLLRFFEDRLPKEEEEDAEE